MSFDPFPLFLALVHYDQETASLERESKKFTAKIAVLNQHINDLKKTTEDQQLLVAAVQKKVDTQELLMQQLDATYKQKKNVLQATNNSKEFTGLQKEITHLEQELRTNEEILISYWQASENASQTFQEQQITNTQRKNAWKKEIAQITQNQNALNTILQERAIHRDEKRHNVSQELLDKYVSLQGKIEDPVVPVCDESCSACAYYMPRQERYELKTKRLMQCKGCFRYLYFADDPLNRLPV